MMALVLEPKEIHEEHKDFKKSPSKVIKKLWKLELSTECHLKRLSFAKLMKRGLSLRDKWNCGGNFMTEK